MENWKPVAGFGGAYQVSDHGNVRRVIGGQGTQADRLIKPVLMKIGYTKFGLSHRGQSRQVYGHRLVMETFVGPCPRGITVNHLNGIRHDNRLCNLEYATRAEQEHHAHRVLGKRSPIGEQSGRAKLTEEQVRAIRALRPAHTLMWLAKQFGVCYSTVRMAAIGKHWKHLN